MKTKILIVSLIILFISSLIYAQPQIKREEIQRSAPQQQRGTQISDEPVIREFSLNPTFWLQGQSGEMTFNWRVEPSPGGTPITRITITKTSSNGPVINFSSSDLRGQYKLPIPSSLGQGRTTYAFTAVNQAGRTKTETVDFEVTTLNNLRGQISITGDSFSINFIGFNFSEGSSEEFIDEQRIKHKTREALLSKISKKIDVVTARGFLSNEDRVFRETGNSFREVFKTRERYGEFFFKEDIIWRTQSTGRERIFGDINTYKDIKVFVIHGNTSMIGYKAEAGGNPKKSRIFWEPFVTCKPILHGDKGLAALPTYHGLSRQATNSFEGFYTQVKWSCPALPSLLSMGKTHAYKFYNKNFS